MCGQTARERASNVKRKCGSAAAATAAVVLSITKHRQSQLTAMHVKHNYVYIQRLNSTLAPSQLLSCVPLSRMQNNKQSNSRWGNQNKRRDTQTQAPTPICDFVAKTEKEMCEVSALFDWLCLSLFLSITLSLPHTTQHLSSDSRTYRYEAVIDDALLSFYRTVTPAY